MDYKLLNDFVKQVTKTEAPPETKINGTVKVRNGITYVKLDGSDILTPINTTVEVDDGDRVTAEIKDHKATIIANITSPSVNNRSFANLKDEVDENGNRIKMMNTALEALDSSVSIMGSTIVLHDSAIQSINDAVQSQGNAISAINNSISVMDNNIRIMSSDIQLQNARINLNSSNISALESDVSLVRSDIALMNTSINAINNTITLQGNDIGLINSNISSIGSTLNFQQSEINTSNANITILNSGFVIQNGVITGLSGAVLQSLDTEYLHADFANFEAMTAETIVAFREHVKQFYADSAIISNIGIDQGYITGELHGVTIRGDLIQAGTVVADKLIIKDADTPENGIIYAINNGVETNEELQDISNAIHGSSIIKESITANKIYVSDLSAFNATIGGFQLDDNSIHSISKPTINSDNNPGLFMDETGQFNIGDINNRIKYYYDENQNEWVLDVRLSKLYLGSSSQTADQEIGSMLAFTADSLTNTFKSTGGSNLLLNSVGFKNKEYWTVVLGDANISTNQNQSILSSGSEFILGPDSEMRQAYKTEIGETYSLSFKYKFTEVNSGDTAEISLNGSTTSRAVTIEDSTNDWVKSELLEYVASVTNPFIDIKNIGNGTLEITDLIISKGVNDVWSPNANEIYSGTHKFDKDGLSFYKDNKQIDINASSIILSDNSLQNDKIVSEISQRRIYSTTGEFKQDLKIGRLCTTVLDANNIIEYIGDV